MKNDFLISYRKSLKPLLSILIILFLFVGNSAAVEVFSERETVNTSSSANPNPTSELPNDEQKKLSILALIGAISVLAILGLTIAFASPLFLFLSFIPVIFGIISLVKIKKSPKEFSKLSKILAYISLGLGGAGLIFSLIVFIALLSYLL